MEDDIFAKYRKKRSTSLASSTTSSEDIFAKYRNQSTITEIPSQETITTPEKERQEMIARGEAVSTQRRFERTGKNTPSMGGSLVRGISNLPLKVVASGKNVINAIEGKDENEDLQVSEYFGKIERIGKGFDVTKGLTKENIKALKDAVGTGAEAASYLIGAKPLTTLGGVAVKQLTKQEIKKRILKEAMRVAKYEATAGAVGAGGFAAQEGKDLKGIIKDALIGAGFGTALGFGLGGAGAKLKLGKATEEVEAKVFTPNDTIKITDKETGKSTERIVKRTENGDVIATESISGIPNKYSPDKFDFELIKKGEPTKEPIYGTGDTFIDKTDGQKIIIEKVLPDNKYVIKDKEGIPITISEKYIKENSTQTTEVPSTRGETVLRAAVEKKLIDAMDIEGEVPTHVKERVTQWANDADQYIKENPDDYMSVATGKKSHPNAEAIYTAAEIIAIRDGDVAKIRELAKSSVPTEAGRGLKKLDSADPNSPVKIIRDVTKAREEAATKTVRGKNIKKAQETVIKKGKAEVKTARMKMQEAQALLDRLIC